MGWHLAYRCNWASGSNGMRTQTRYKGCDNLSFLGRWMAKLVACLLATAALWFRTSNPDISHQKYKMDDISKAIVNTHYPAKKYTLQNKTSFFSHFYLMRWWTWGKSPFKSSFWLAWSGHLNTSEMDNSLLASGSWLDPDSIGPVDPDTDPDSGSGSRKAKMTHNSRKKFVKVHVLKCWMASFEGWRLLL